MKLDIEYEIWRINELDHGFEMDAKENLPAGSMLNLSSDCGFETYYVSSYFHREERK